MLGAIIILPAPQLFHGKARYSIHNAGPQFQDGDELEQQRLGLDQTWVVSGTCSGAELPSFVLKMAEIGIELGDVASACNWRAAMS